MASKSPPGAANDLTYPWNPPHHIPKTKGDLRGAALENGSGSMLRLAHVTLVDNVPREPIHPCGRRPMGTV